MRIDITHSSAMGENKWKGCYQASCFLRYVLVQSPKTRLKNYQRL